MGDLEDKSRQESTETELFFNLVPDLLCIASAEDGYFKELNPAWEKTLGFTREELLSKPLVEFIHPDDRASTMSEVEKQLKGQSTAYFENRYICKDGSYRWLAWTATPSKGSLLYATARDITEHKKSEEAMQESETGFRTVLENSRDLSYKFNLKTGKYDYVTPSVKNMLGISVEDFLKGGIDLVVSLFHPEDKIRLQEHISDILAAKVGDEIIPPIEYRIKHRELGYRLFSDNRTLIRDKDNTPIAIVGNSRDITESRKAEDDLISSENKFRELFNNANDAIYLWELGEDGMPGRCIEVNDIACRMLGYTKDELLAMTPRDIDTEESVSKIPGIMNEMLAKGRTTFEMIHMTKDGHRIPVEISSHIYSVEGEKVILSISRDITERRKADQALLESEEKFRTYYEKAPLGYQSLDENGCFINVNEAWLETLQYSRDEVIGRSFADFLAPGYVDKFRKNFPCFKAEGKIVGIEFEMVCKDGSNVTVAFNGKIGYNLDGSFKQTHCLLQDISERKRLEEEMSKSHKLESIGILAGGIAHDFNNLLAAIRNNIYLAMMHVDRENTAYENLELTDNIIHRATNLTQQLLTFSKGGSPIKKTASMIDLIRESAEFVLKGSNVKCEYNSAENLCPVEVDEGQISQVIHNLILNADQSMPEGGTIHISAENISFDSDAGLPLQEGKHVKVVIQDQGVGIAEDNLKKIFDPYFTTKEMGRGLGLSIIYSIIKNHDGYIAVESELGVGTTFTIYLPASDKQIEVKETEEDSFTDGDGKVLIMDDEKIIRESVGQLLMLKGYEVESVKDGDEAIALYKKAMEALQPFDAVILDLTIRGGMGGKDVVKKLLEIDPNVKAIVASGYSNDPVLSNFREYGFVGVFAKHDKTAALGKTLYKVIKG